MPYYLPIAGGRIIGIIPFPMVLVLYEMQSVSSRIWTRVAVSISYDDNHYTIGIIIITFMSPSLFSSLATFEYLFIFSLLSLFFTLWSTEVAKSIWWQVLFFLLINARYGGARGVMVIVVGNGHGHKSWTKLIAFHIVLIPLGKVWIQLFSLQLWVNSMAD